PQIFTLTNLSGVKPRQDLGQNGVEDMIQLTDLNEASLLWNLKIRYDKELIYTYTGSILVAVNPYKMFDIYGLDQVKLYEGRILGTLPPHLFAVGSSAYSQVTAANNSSANQVVVISGESGSGKTESTKLVMQYLAAVNRAPNNLVTEQILEATPLLESFGNAKTPRNDNSSRFGKYLEVHFRDGAIIGGRITQYLLEKSRIVTQASEERNYHVFYELLAGLDQQLRDKYGLLTPDKYFYLNQGGNCEIDGKSDVQDFKALLSAMQVLGFSSEEQDTIFRILSSVLHLGNVYFHRKQMRHGQEGVEVGSDAEIRWAAHLLQVNSDGIIRALTTKTTEARNERVFTALNIDQALDARDAFAKALYSSLFSWLVARVNHIVYKGTKQTAAISILDIFGFENFTENSFEQLCINYANENLQFYFNKHIFKLEQQEYAKEKIDWTTINYTDNLPVIHLIAKKPVGILHLLDDESNFPKATDLSFLEKCHYNHALSELYSRPRMNSAEFAIRHYAGQVWYNVEGFLDKNRDTLRPDVVELLISSKISMVSKMFQHVRNTHEANKTMNKPNGRFVTMKPRTPTVSARFHDSLQQLLESMSQCNPWFVRCIKPNTEKAPMKFDMPCVLEQLRYTGMLETIRIRKTGYPVRLLFGHFVDRYRYLVSTHLPRGAPNKELCRIILDKAAPKEAQSQYQLGLTRVFLRESLERALEYNRALILERAAITVQRYTRGFLARRRFLNISRSTVLIQAVYRGYRERKQFRAMKKGVLMAQKLYRGRKQREAFKILKEEMAKRAEIERASKERAKAKQQREEQERTSRAVAGVNHLEIPAELAFIYSKLDDWQPTHTERNLLKVVGQVIPINYTYNLPSDIDQYQFSKFTNIYFKSHIFGMKREPIKTPFLAKARDQDYTDSLMIFKMILRFMNESNLNGKREQALGDYIVNKGIVNEKLRDEILCQLANQTWKNENDANKERGWLLLSNCLSAFQPSATLFKYLLKYVSDHAYDGYKAYCQRKLLQGERTVHRMMINNQQTVHQVSRNYPPCVLEWRANRNRVNMALNVGFYDGETTTCAIDSWTTCEELANLAVRNHGVENTGWTITLWNQLDGPDAIVTETNGFDYVLDLISEMELAPAFPAAKHMFLEQRKNSLPPIKKREMRKQSHDIILETTTEMGLSRKSALNDRYFEKEKQRSRSLDNLLQSEVVPSPVKLANLGLSSSKLNERYHSLERIGETSAVSNVEYMTRKRALPGSQSSRAYIEKSEYGVKSSAMSDTSEAPSLASHVRRVRVPSQASDVDQFLDELFMPVLDGNLDELSDARSLAASIKGSYDTRPSGDQTVSENLQEFERIDNRVVRIATVDDFVEGMMIRTKDVNIDASELSKKIKGGGNMDIPNQNAAFNFTPIAQSMMSPPMMMPMFNATQQVPSAQNTSMSMGASFMPIPIYSMQGLSLPQYPNSPPGQNNDMMAYQQNLQRAFLQSAMAQNIQIQQQLLAQNQALQQLLVQSPQNSGQQPSNFTNVLSELKNRKSSVDSNPSSLSNNKGVPPPPPMPPPLESHDPSESRPFLDPYGRAKTVRIGKWRWPPPSDSNENQGQDSFIEFKMRQQQQQRKLTPQYQEYDQGEGETTTEGGVEWEEFEIENIVSNEDRSAIAQTTAAKYENGYKEEGEKKKKKSKSALEVGAQRPSPGSIGKLKLSSEMRQRLEKVTANHSVRSTKTAEKPALPREDGKVKRLEDNRKLLLEQQLGGRWDDYASTVDDTQSVTSKGTTDMMTQAQVVRTQIERMERPVPPPPPVTPPQPPSPRGGSVYSNSQSGVPQPRSPPAPIEPKTRDSFRTSPDSETYDHFSKNQMFSQSRDIFASQQHLREGHDYRNDFDKIRAQDAKSKDFYSKDSTDLASSTRDHNSDFDSRRDLNSELFDSKYAFDGSTGKRDPFGMTRDVSPKSRDSFGMPSPRDFGVIPNTRESFTVARQSFNKLDRDVDRRSSVASTHRTDKMERIEIEEWPEFLKPVLPPADKPEIEKVQEVMNTKLYPQTSNAHFTYNRVTWTLRVKKEVFAPNETLNSPLALHLVFCQVVYDVLATSSIRITKEDRQNMLKMLDNYGVTLDNLQSTQHKITIKKNVVDMAKQWPLYFARIFPVSIGPQHPETQHVAVSHHGLRLIKRTLNGDLIILETLPLEDIVSVNSSRPGVCVLQIASGVRLPLHTNRAPQLTEMIGKYIRLVIKSSESELSSDEYGYTDDSGAFLEQASHSDRQYKGKRNGFIKFFVKDGSKEKKKLDSEHLDVNKNIKQILEPFKKESFGQQKFEYENIPRIDVSKLDQKTFLHPVMRANDHQPTIEQLRLEEGCELRNFKNTAALKNIQEKKLGQQNRVPNHVSAVNQANHQKNLQNQRLSPSQEWRQPDDNVRLQEDGIYESGPVVSNDGKHSLLQYAMLNFRQSTENKKKNKKNKGQQDGAEWTWKEQVDLVKYSTVPIEQSLLRLDADLSVLAVECFLCLMRYMGDQPLPPETSEVKCVYTILMHCHKYEQLRDEVYCQLMKQTTNNKSPNPESCQRGWRIFSIIAAYFTCSEGLRPYLTKYLETAAYDKRRAYHGTAMVCLQNLRKTVKYGGRKNVPSVEEIMAISAGRNAKRQIYRLPGGTERVINTKCTTVVQDVIEEMCNVISVRNPHEMDEFSLYCIVDGDAFTMPLARDEYVLDVTTELQKNHQVFYLIFCRSVWYYPLRLDAALYIEVVFNQIAPDYLEGLLLVLPGEHLPQEIIYDMAQIAALLHRAADMTHEPATKEIKYLLPKTALSLREPRPQQWSNMVQQAWNNVQHSSAATCKAQVLEILSKWPLFGSSFFAVKRVPEGKEKGADHILALNRHGVHFIDLITHETLYHYPYSEVISTRKVKSEEGTLYLDMKCGNLMQQRITRLQTEQAHEISRLIRQYITMEQ
ncbi:Myosin-XV, partial [Acromyrmex echinatior]